jgi:hypothetical protein
MKELTTSAEVWDEIALSSAGLLMVLSERLPEVSKVLRQHGEMQE